MFARYFLFQTGATWAVTLEGQVLARYPSRTEATEAAIVMADLMGAMHHDADVMVSAKGTLELIWSFGEMQAPTPRVRQRVPLPPSPSHVVQSQRAASAP